MKQDDEKSLEEAFQAIEEHDIEAKEVFIFGDQPKKVLDDLKEWGKKEI